MKSEEILEELVEQTGEISECFGLTFETLEDYWALADARLSAFASGQMWVVIFEIVGYDPGPDEYASHIFLLGNCVKPRETIYLPNVSRTLFLVPNSWNKEIEKDQLWGIERDKFSLLYRGQRHDFAPTLEDLQRAGIELSTREIESGELSPQQMLRFVCKKLDHPFFMSEDALRGLLDANAIDFKWKFDEKTKRSGYESAVGQFQQPPLLSVALELILQTRDWIHPKVGDANFDNDEWEISPDEAFAVLAQTLATGDVAAWNAQDATKFNSHWRNWAEIEAEKEREDAQRLSDAKTVFRAFVEDVPLAERVKFLEHLRPTIEKSPSFFNWSFQQHIDRDGKIIQIFCELLEEADVMLADLQNNQ